MIDEKHGEGILEFYLNKMMESKIDEIKRRAISSLPQHDPEFLIAKINEEMREYKQEVASKAHWTMMLVMDHLLMGDLDQLRKFEVMFTDLLERTLLKRHDLVRALDYVAKKLKEMTES